MPTPARYRFGNELGSVTWCHVPPALVASPRAKPALLHGPHQLTQPVPPRIATAVAEWPAPRSNALVHSDALRIPQPLVEVYTYCPPAMNPLAFSESIAIGAMNRGAGSPWSWLHDSDTTALSAPLFSAQVLVIFTARATYSGDWPPPFFRYAG